LGELYSKKFAPRFWIKILSKATSSSRFPLLDIRLICHRMSLFRVAIARKLHIDCHIDCPQVLPSSFARSVALLNMNPHQPHVVMLPTSSSPPHVQAWALLGTMVVCAVVMGLFYGFSAAPDLNNDDWAAFDTFCSAVSGNTTATGLIAAAVVAPSVILVPAGLIDIALGRGERAARAFRAAADYSYAITMALWAMAMVQGPCSYVLVSRDVLGWLTVLGAFFGFTFDFTYRMWHIHKSCSR